jgi:hypothetical protein
MSDQLLSFANKIDVIQSKCCCHSLDARDCIRSRYSIDPDDDDNDDQRCECACHSEIAEEEASQDWP